VIGKPGEPTAHNPSSDTAAMPTVGALRSKPFLNEALAMFMLERAFDHSNGRIGWNTDGPLVEGGHSSRGSAGLITNGGRILDKILLTLAGHFH